MKLKVETISTAIHNTTTHTRSLTVHEQMKLRKPCAKNSYMYTVILSLIIWSQYNRKYTISSYIITNLVS